MLSMPRGTEGRLRSSRAGAKDDGARRHLVTTAHVPYPEGTEVAAAQLAVDAGAVGRGS